MFSTSLTKKSSNFRFFVLLFHRECITMNEEKSKQELHRLVGEILPFHTTWEYQEKSAIAMNS